MSDLKWEDKEFRGLIGDTEVAVLSTLSESGKQTDSDKCILLRYVGANTPKIYALRWSLGAILDLGTEDLDVAKGSIQTMLIMEDSDND